MYEQIERTVTILLDSFLADKLDAESIRELLAQDPTLLTELSQEFDTAIKLFNEFRRIEFPSYMSNSIELAAAFQHDLPLYTEMELSEELIKLFGQQLHDDPYFVEIWQIKEPKILLCNLLMLVYRNYMLTTYKSNLVGSDGKRKVQISSSIEEMCFQLLIDGHKMEITDAFMIWLKDWKGEGFSEELYKLVRP